MLFGIIYYRSKERDVNAIYKDIFVVMFVYKIYVNHPSKCHHIKIVKSLNIEILIIRQYNHLKWLYIRQYNHLKWNKI